MVQYRNESVPCQFELGVLCQPVCTQLPMGLTENGAPAQAWKSCCVDHTGIATRCIAAGCQPLGLIHVGQWCTGHMLVLSLWQHVHYFAICTGWHLGLCGAIVQDERLQAPKDTRPRCSGRARARLVTSGF